MPESKCVYSKKPYVFDSICRAGILHDWLALDSHTNAGCKKGGCRNGLNIVFINDDGAVDVALNL